LFGTALIAGFNVAESAGAPAKKETPEEYAKKLVGVWEGTEDFGGKTETITLEFKKDGAMTLAMGPFTLKGTFKVTKQDGKTVVIDSEMTIEGFDDAKGKPDKKSLKIVFDDADNVTISKDSGKPEPKKFKRKK
jgi:hypothetical protein